MDSYRTTLEENEVLKERVNFLELQNFEIKRESGDKKASNEFLQE